MPTSRSSWWTTSLSGPMTPASRSTRVMKRASASSMDFGRSSIAVPLACRPLTAGRCISPHLPKAVHLGGPQYPRGYPQELDLPLPILRPVIERLPLQAHAEILRGERMGRGKGRSRLLDLAQADEADDQI